MSADAEKIIDIPSHKKMLRMVSGMKLILFILKAAKTLGIKSENTEEMISQFSLVMQQSKIIFLPDKFNEHFSKAGWIAHELMNAELMEQAISLAENDQFDQAEELLADYYKKENLEWLLLCLSGLEAFRKREELVKLAQEDYLASRFHACIPLLLAVIDGMVNDIAQTQTGFFTNVTNLTAWDSIAAHSTGLQKLSQLFNSPRKKTSTEKITIPYRNGILHGRDINFANKLVAAKCWAALFAIRDWALAVKSENDRKLKEEAAEKGFLETIKSAVETQALSERLDRWMPRKLTLGLDTPQTGLPSVYAESSPERTLSEFLHFWKQKNYGNMARLLTDFTNKPVNTKAREVRNDFGLFEFIDFQLISITDSVPAKTEIEVAINYKNQTREQTAKVLVEMIYLGTDHLPTLRDEAGGEWTIFQRSFSPIIYPNLQKGLLDSLTQI